MTDVQKAIRHLPGYLERIAGHENEYRPALVAFAVPDRAAAEKIMNVFWSGEVKGPFAGVLGRILEKGPHFEHIAANGHYTPSGQEYIAYVGQPRFIKEHPVPLNENSGVNGFDKYAHAWITPPNYDTGKEGVLKLVNDPAQLAKLRSQAIGMMLQAKAITPRAARDAEENVATVITPRALAESSSIKALPDFTYQGFGPQQALVAFQMPDWPSALKLQSKFNTQKMGGLSEGRALYVGHEGRGIATHARITLDEPVLYLEVPHLIVKHAPTRSSWRERSEFDYSNPPAPGVPSFVKGPEQLEAWKQVALSIMQKEGMISAEVAKGAGFDPSHSIFGAQVAVTSRSR